MRVEAIGSTEADGHALIFGDIADDCLVRIHSRCLYGDALESQDCDCGPELSVAMDLIQAAGSGVLIYLEQEGRGAGLVAKARGYQVSQANGIDTFASYSALGYSPDARTYLAAAGKLRDLKLTRIRLLTNNPDKVAAVRLAGIDVRPLALRIPPRNRAARGYLDAKREFRGHHLPRSWWIYRVANALVLAAFVGTFSGCYVAFVAVTEVVAFERLMILATVTAASLWGWSRTRFLRARIRLLSSRFADIRLNSAPTGTEPRP